jgi:hypothetical protein
MARPLKQSTSVDVPIGPFLDATDGITAETGLTITQPDVRLKKNNGNWAQKAAAQTLTHEENGFYEVTLDATDTDTLGLLRLAVFESGACPVWEDFVVLPANVFDSGIGATDVLQVDVAQWLGTAPATPTVAGVPEVDLTHVAGATTDVSTIPASVAAILVDTAVIGSTGQGLTSLATQASVNTIDDFLDTEIAAILAAVTGAIEDSVPADGSRPTPRQALYMITQFLYERAVSGTTVTVNKVDGTTALLTLTLNDGTTPTAITRAT